MSENDLIISIENGVIDFNALLNRVKSLEENMNKIKNAVETIDKNLTYLLEQDNKSNEVFINHAEAIKSIREHLNEIRTVTNTKQHPTKNKLHISCKLIKEPNDEQQ